MANWRAITPRQYRDAGLFRCDTCRRWLLPEEFRDTPTARHRHSGRSKCLRCIAAGATGTSGGKE